MRYTKVIVTFLSLSIFSPAICAQEAPNFLQQEEGEQVTVVHFCIGDEQSIRDVQFYINDKQVIQDMMLAAAAKKAQEKYAFLRLTEIHKNACLDRSITDEQFYEQCGISREEVVSIFVAHMRLLEAANAGQLMSVQVLAPVCVLDTGHYEEGLSALHAASKNGFLEIAAHLVQCGASVNIKDRQGRTPLDLARANGHAEVVALLLSSGAKDQVGEKGVGLRYQAQETEEKKEQRNQRGNNSKKTTKKKSWWSWCS